MRLFNLDENSEPIEVFDVADLYDLMKDDERRTVIKTELFGEQNHGTLISTVFLMFDHNLGRQGKPILYETRIFGESKDFTKLQWRYHDRETALEEHKKIVTALENNLPLPD